MGAWTRAMIRYRWAVVGAWAVVLVVSVLAMSGLTDLLTNRFTLPGTDTARAEAILEREFGQKTTGSFSVVVEGAPAAGDVAGAELYVSGQAAIEHDLDPVFAHDLKVGELYIAIPIALLILVFTFGTLAFLLPFVFALAAIPTTLGIVWIFAHFMELTTYLQNLVMLIGLGIAIDYSLLVVYRYREELAKGGSKEDALVRTMKTAGRAVVFSGTAVGIGLALMLFMPLPFMRGFGIGGLAIPLVSIVCALTLLPVLLYFLAARLDGVRGIPKRIT